MKIIGGEYRGKNFYMPKEIRPTQNMAREALFNMLGQTLEGIVFLDLFAGSGAVGLEAISRGASEVVFVEKDPKNADVITENVRFLGIDHSQREVKIDVFNTDAFAMIKEFALKKRTFDVIFIDPPYGRELTKKALKTLNAHAIIHPNSVIIIEHEKRDILPEALGSFLLYKQKHYGRTYFSVYNINRNTS